MTTISSRNGRPHRKHDDGRPGIVRASRRSPWVARCCVPRACVSRWRLSRRLPRPVLARWRLLVSAAPGGPPRPQPRSWAPPLPSSRHPSWRSAMQSPVRPTTRRSRITLRRAITRRSPTTRRNRITLRRDTLPRRRTMRRSSITLRRTTTRRLDYAPQQYYAPQSYNVPQSTYAPQPQRYYNAPVVDRQLLSPRCSAADVVPLRLRPLKRSAFLNH